MSPCKYKVYDNKPYVGKIRILYQSAPCRPLGALQQPFLVHLFFLKAPRSAPRQSAANDGADDDA
jgi:hypothetical protein